MFNGAGYIGRGASATNAFNLTSAQHGQVWPNHGSGNNVHQRRRPTGYVLTGHIAVAAFRNNEQVGSQAAINNLLETYGTTGRWATHVVERHIGSMAVDSSRFSNLGQVPGMRFNAIVGNASGDVSPTPGNPPAGNRNTDVQVMNSRLAGAAQGNVIRMGTYTHAFNAYHLPTGQVFASRGVQIPVATGTSTTLIEFENAQMMMISTEENVGTSCAPIWERVDDLPLGNRNFVRFDFALIGTDKAPLRTAATATRMPDEFYQNYTTMNTNRGTLMNRLGNPLEANVTVPSLAGVSDIGPGLRWELNAPPAITSVATTSTLAGTAGTFQVTATGTDPITFALTGAPAGVTIDSATGLISIADTTAVGTHNFTITASGVAPDATQAFTLTVTAAPIPPTITSAAAMSVVAGTASTFPVTATGTAPIAFSLTGAPAGVTINAATGVISIPATVVVGTHEFAITASGVAPDATQDFTLTVTAAPVPPAITSANSTSAVAGTASTFQVTATGTAPITFSLVGAPAGVTIDSATGLISIAANAPVGTRTFIVRASGVAPAATQNFTLTVTAAGNGGSGPNFIFSTSWPSTIWNWVMFFGLFGFIWMWFISP
jgi:hypothetical protein